MGDPQHEDNYSIWLCADPQGGCVACKQSLIMLPPILPYTGRQRNNGWGRKRPGSSVEPQRESERRRGAGMRGTAVWLASVHGENIFSLSSADAVAGQTGRKWPPLNFNHIGCNKLKVRVVGKPLEEFVAELQVEKNKKKAAPSVSSRRCTVSSMSFQQLTAEPLQGSALDSFYRLKSQLCKPNTSLKYLHKKNNTEIKGCET